MLGDIILYLKRVLKQHLFCIHDYKLHILGMGEYSYYECTKCNKLRDTEP
jgi:bacterioferritin (cytochrome b1)